MYVNQFYWQCRNDAGGPSVEGALSAVQHLRRLSSSSFAKLLCASAVAPSLAVCCSLASVNTTLLMSGI